MLKYYLTAFIGIFLIACSSTGKIALKKEQLPQLIDSLYQADQATSKIKPTDSAVAAYQRVIRTNFPYVTAIYSKYGYPGYDAVGKDYSNKYFLLVQHSDFDVPFQQKVLASMKKEVEKQNASGQSFAYLTDRIEINNGRPQVYGTQVQMSANTTIKPCIDAANLDKRRKAAGLGPIKDYLEKCNETFYELNPQLKKQENKNQ